MFTKIFKVIRKNPELGVSLRRKTLGWSQLEGGLYALMVGCTETFALYYGVKLGFSKQEIALISMLPVLFGAMANWVIPQIVSARHLKTALLSVVFTQILGVLGLFFSVNSAQPFWWILISLTLYWIGGMSAGPLWIDWMSGWLPEERLGRYLFRRNAFTALFTVFGYLVGAYWIHSHAGLSSYRIVFGIAFVARICSWTILYFQPHPIAVEVETSEAFKVSKALQSKPIILMIVFTVLFRFVASISSPFFLPYMVDELRLNLLEVSWITAVPFLSRAFFLSQWGEAVRTYRPFIALQFGMFFLGAICLAWTLTTNIALLSGVEALSGIAWGGLELAVVVILQNFAPRRARGLIGLQLALFHLASLFGALAGSKLLVSGWDSLEIFQLSAYLRWAVGAAFVLIGFRTKEMKVAIKVYGEFFMTAMSIRPQLFALGRFIPLPLKKRKKKFA